MAKIKYTVFVIILLFSVGFLIDTTNSSAQPVSSSNQAKSEELGGNIVIPATEDLMREHGVLNRILLIYEEWLDILCRPDFLDFIELGTSATRTDAELVHKIALSAPEELQKKPGLAALAMADVESEDEEHLADQVAQKVLAHLATKGLVHASR